MRVEDLVVEVRNRIADRVGLIRPEDLVLEATALHNNVGEWKVTLPAEHPLAAELRQPGSGIVISGPGGVILSGPTTSPEKTLSAEDPAGTTVFSGVGDAVVLADALAWPQPTNSDVTTQTTGYDTRTGPAESLMHQYVRANIGPDATAARRVSRLAMGTDGARGASVTKQARFPKLGDLLTELAAPSSLGFRVTDQDTAGLLFETYLPADRSKAVRLTVQNGEVATQKITTAAPGLTRAIVAGQGDLEDRTFVERTTPESLAAEQAWGRRIEQFVDQRQTDDLTELATAGDEALAETGRSGLGVQVTPSDSSNTVFGRDWNLGDVVTVEVDGVESSARVTGVAIKADADGFRVGFVIGDLFAFASTGALAQISGFEQRVSSLERNVSAASGGVPVGTIIPWAGAASVGVPSDYLLADGRAVSRTTYASLFAVVGTTYGAGDGSTTFNLPNLVARVPVGQWPGDPDFGTIGQYGGEKAHTLSAAEMPYHNHGLPGHTFSWGTYLGSVWVNGTAATGGYATGGNPLYTVQNSWNSTNYAGGNVAHNNLQPYTVVRYLVKI